jgi:EAL domain-containing protein (putative c-di-GMP-specific phosphodiesterase class I)
MKEVHKPMLSSSHPACPFLEHYPEPGGAPHRILLDQLPFRIGRSMTAHYIIYSRQVSKEHTEIYRVGKDYRIRDLGSTNGTFVNGERIQEATLDNGDIIHVAHKEFRFGHESLDASSDFGPSFTEVSVSQLPASIIRGTMHLREMLTTQSVRIVFQPIVDLVSGTVLGYEVLGRGTHSELSPNPAELFGLANQCNLARDLSQLFRAVAIREAPRLPAGARIFFNIHPSEMDSDTLLSSLVDLKKALRESQQVVLEVHEGVVADIASMHRLRGRLQELEIGLAFDDFGAGQARLAELAEVPPDYIKLDKSLVRNIERAPARQDLIRALCQVSADLGVQTIAEGVETEQEARVCHSLGCRFGQGFLFGRPQPLALVSTKTVTGALAQTPVAADLGGRIDRHP